MKPSTLDTHREVREGGLGLRHPGCYAAALRIKCLLEMAESLQFRQILHLRRVLDTGEGRLPPGCTAVKSKWYDAKFLVVIASRLAQGTNTRARAAMSLDCIYQIVKRSFTHEET